MQAFESLENLVEVLRLDANPIVLNREQPAAFGTLGCYRDIQMPVGTSVFNGVADEVLKQLLQLRLIPCSPRQERRK